MSKTQESDLPSDLHVYIVHAVCVVDDDDKGMNRKDTQSDEWLPCYLTPLWVSLHTPAQHRARMMTHFFTHSNKEKATQLSARLCELPGREKVVSGHGERNKVRRKWEENKVREILPMDYQNGKDQLCLMWAKHTRRINWCILCPFHSSFLSFTFSDQLST